MARLCCCFIAFLMEGKYERNAYQENPFRSERGLGEGQSAPAKFTREFDPHPARSTRRPLPEGEACSICDRSRPLRRNSLLWSDHVAIHHGCRPAACSNSECASSRLSRGNLDCNSRHNKRARRVFRRSAFHGHVPGRGRCR